MLQLLRDIRYAARRLLRKPAFTAIAILSVAIGIGANTAIFSLLDAVMLRPLPVPNPDELSVVYDVGPVAPGDIGAGSGRADIYSWPLIQEFARALPDGAQLAAMTPIAQLNVRLGTDSTATPVNGQLVSGEFFPLFGVRPAFGRLLGPEDNRVVNGHPVAVLGYSFWQRRFGGDPGVIGRTLPVNNVPFTIVGVAEPTFRGIWAASTVQVWVPLVMQPALEYRSNSATVSTNAEEPWPPNPRVYWLNVAVRAPRNQREAIAARLAPLYANSVKGLVDAGAEQPQALDRHLDMESFARGFSVVRDQYSRALSVLMVLVVTLLLAACANVANLLLARWTARQREYAVRMSLGAGRWQIIRQLVAESLVLALTGGVIGLLLAHWISTTLARAAIQGDILPQGVALDPRVLTFCLTVTFATSLAFGLLPALRSTRGAPGARLRADGVREGRAAGVFRPLVAIQVAFSVVLVITAGLLGRSLMELWALDPGYDRNGLVQIRMDPRTGGARPDELLPMYTRAVERARQVPGVVGAEVARNAVGGTSRSISSVTIGGYDPSPGEAVRFMQNPVGPEYFATLGIELIAGRGLTEQDTRSSSRVVVINETAAYRYFNGVTEALGGRWDDGRERVAEVVGVVRDVRPNGLREQPVPMAFLALAQSPPLAETLVLRVEGDGVAIGESVRRILNREEPRLIANSSARLVADELERGLSRDRLVAGLASAFGAVGLLLACIGLYGVLNYTVARRIPEMGVRLALGATPARIVRLVLGEGLRVVTLGGLAGLAVAAATSRLLQSLIFSISPLDPLVYLSAPIALVVVGAIAAYVPARRAGRVDPVTALRSE